MPSEKTALRFHDILDSIEHIEQFTATLSKSDLKNDLKTRFAVERAIAIISEAAVKLGDEAQKFAPDIPWPAIRGIGNLIRHAYDIVSLDTIWTVVTDDLPPLKEASMKALEDLNSTDNPMIHGESIPKPESS